MVNANQLKTNFRFNRKEIDMSTTKNSRIANEIRVLLKGTPEQQTVVGPLVQHLLTLGWTLDQMVFGKKEWRIPKSPSEATRREKGHSYAGFPVDIAVFDSPKTCGDPAHILFLRGNCKTR